MDLDAQNPEAAPPDYIPLDSILSEPLTRPLNLTPRTAVQPPPLPRPLASRVTAISIWRDAVLDFIAAIGVTLAAALIIVAGSSAIAVTRPGTLSGLSPQAYAGLFVASQVPLYLFARRRLKRNREKGQPPPQLFAGNPTRAAVWGVAAGLVLTIVSRVYVAILQRLLGEEAVPQQLDILGNLATNNFMLAAMVFIIAIMAPICEEMLFRGAMFAPAFAAGLPVPGALISAALFATAHLSLNLFPFYAVFALTMCWLFARTGSLLAPMSAHFTMNALACIAFIAQRPSEVI